MPCPSRFTPRKETRYSLYRWLEEPKGPSRWVCKIFPTLGFDPRTVQPVANRCTHAIPGHILYYGRCFWLLFYYYYLHPMLMPPVNKLVLQEISILLRLAFLNYTNYVIKNLVVFVLLLSLLFERWVSIQTLPDFFVCFCLLCCVVFRSHTTKRHSW